MTDVLRDGTVTREFVSTGVFLRSGAPASHKLEGGA